MVHARIVKPALERLDEKRAAYFADVLSAIEEDRRTERMPNLVYLVLGNTIEHLPTHLPRKDMIDLLFAFLQSNRGRLAKRIYDPEFIHDPNSIRTVTNEFVHAVIDIVLEMAKSGQIEEKSRGERRFSWPYDNVDLPYVDTKT